MPWPYDQKDWEKRLRNIESSVKTMRRAIKKVITPRKKKRSSKNR